MQLCRELLNIRNPQNCKSEKQSLHGLHQIVYMMGAFVAGLLLRWEIPLFHIIVITRKAFAGGADLFHTKSTCMPSKPFMYVQCCYKACYVKKIYSGIKPGISRTGRKQPINGIQSTPDFILYLSVHNADFTMRCSLVQFVRI